ncbi:MAG: type II toxin-antitoxin system RelB/DinJ family antitoxin [Bacteroidales bacterium]|nr:type II toxin-antitoxin system RelB/DinJ family antitoxin [Bacteroidales bacterium]
MSKTTINIRTDAEIKEKSQKIFETFGFDMTTAINLFLRQTVLLNNLPFSIGHQNEINEKPAVRKPLEYGSLKGEIWTAADFNAPLDDFSEYIK